MINHRRSIVAFAVGVAVASTVYAEVSPASGFGAGAQQAVHACARRNLNRASLSSLCDSPQAADLKLWFVEFSPATDSSTSAETQPAQTLEHGPSSFSFGLSALLGLGLYASTHLGKRLRLGCVPDWFHDSGPFQIAHSHAATPQSLCTPQVCCFVQPAYSAEASAPPYRLGTIVSLWRESQFTRCVIASRGPPLS